MSRKFLEYEFPDSTAIKKYRYFRPQQSLVVEFTSGKVYAYADVKEDVVLGWAGAASAGRYYHKWIRHHAEFRPDPPKARGDNIRRQLTKIQEIRTPTTDARIYYWSNYSHLPIRSRFDVLRELKVHNRWNDNRAKHRNTTGK